MSGYTNCACLDCMDIAITGDDNKPALCLLCKDAGCEISYGAYMGGTGAHSTECQRDDAYGDDPSRSCGCGATGAHGVDHED